MCGFYTCGWQLTAILSDDTSTINAQPAALLFAKHKLYRYKGAKSSTELLAFVRKALDGELQGEQIPPERSFLDKLLGVPGWSRWQLTFHLRSESSWALTCPTQALGAFHGAGRALKSRSPQCKKRSWIPGRAAGCIGQVYACQSGRHEWAKPIK